MKKSLIAGLVLLFVGIGDARAQFCFGDCNANGVVTINELIIAVNIALGTLDISACSYAYDDTPRINDLIRAVRSALEGCPVVPTATATDSSTPTSTATATVTATEVGTATATATATATETAETPIATATATATATVTATEVGTATATATATPTDSEGTPTATATETEVATATATATVTATEVGTATATATEDAETPTPTATATEVEPTATATSTATASATVTATEVGTATATLTATVDAGTPTPTSTATQPEDSPTPTITQPEGTATPTATATATATATEIPLVSLLERLYSGALADILMLDLFNSGIGDAVVFGAPTPMACPAGGTREEACVELGGMAMLSYTFDACASQDAGVETVVDGEAEMTTMGTCEAPFPVDQTATAAFTGTVGKTVIESGESSAVTQDVMMTFRVDSDGTIRFRVNGSLDASCLGSTAMVQTLSPVVIAGGAACPSEGTFLIVIDGLDHKIDYTPAGGVRFDVGANNFFESAYGSCNDPEIDSCFE